MTRGTLVLVGSLLDAAGDLLLGTCCPGCRGPVAGLCPECRAALDEPLARVHRSGLEVPVVSAGNYAGVPREVVAAFKEHGVWSLAALLGDRLARAAMLLCVAHGHPDPPVIVPVPSSRRTVRRRGLDTTAALAGRCAQGLREVGVTARSRSVLTQQSGVRDQVGLGVAERSRNLADGLRLARPVEGCAVIVVDDIVTSGATLRAAVDVLEAAGAHVLGAATVVQTPLRHGFGVEPGPHVPAERVEQTRPPR